MLEELKRKPNLLWGSSWNVVPLCHTWIILKERKRENFRDGNFRLRE